jgi:N-acetylneuraminate synthase/N,N'-diacetyllegionaminate synthase
MKEFTLPEKYGDPFLIAEIGGNHEGNFEYAQKLLRDAVAGGAHAVKFQTYSPAGLVNPKLDPGRYQHFAKFSLSIEQFKVLAELARSHDVLFMSSLWDSESVEALDPYIQIHKVGSGDLTNFPLLEVIAKKNKPLLISTAMATIAEISDTVSFIREVNPTLITQGKFALLHCVAMYGDPQDSFAHLLAIRVLQDQFPDIKIGYSDHTVGNTACELALGLGAGILEFHFTDDKSRDFRDHHISLNKDDLTCLLGKAKQFRTLLGSLSKKPEDLVETPARIREFRRGLYLGRDMKKGDTVVATDLVSLRPCVGLSPTDYRKVVGKVLLRDIDCHDVLSWEDLG